MEYLRTGTPELGPEYLKPSEFFNFDQAAVRDFAEGVVEGAETPVEQAVKLYYAVRDSIRYDPYRISLDRELFQASHLLGAGAGFCLPKANLLIASARAVGIAAAIGLSDVANPLCTERLRRLMGGKELFLHHGYAVLHLDGVWVKAAPAFNIELCEKFGVLATEFDGRGDALFQPYDAKGRRHMEYVADHGIWSDFPYDRVVDDFRDYYPPSFFEEADRLAVNRQYDEERQFDQERPLA